MIISAVHRLWASMATDKISHLLGNSIPSPPHQIVLENLFRRRALFETSLAKESRMFGSRVDSGGDHKSGKKTLESLQKT